MRPSKLGGKSCAIFAILWVASTAQASARQVGVDLPLRFEPNRGQADPVVRFVARAQGYRLLVTATALELALVDGGAAKGAAPRSALVGLQFTSGAGAHEIVASEPLAGASHYLRGRDAAKWCTDVPGFARLTCREVAPGVDLEIHGAGASGGRQVEFDFVVAPGADLAAVELKASGVTALRLDSNGDLLLDTAAGTLTERAPAIHQVVDGVRRPVEGRYLLRGDDTIGFAVGAHRGDLPLVIDPVLVWSTYLGGTGADQVNDVVVDASGCVYVTGTTSSTDFPIRNAWQPTLTPFYDVFVAKLDPSLTTLIWSTYLGGTADSTHAERGSSLGLDAAGDVFVTGITSAADFPVQNAFQPQFGGVEDAFLLELSAAGNALLFSTYLGGGGDEHEGRLAVDAAGDSFVTGGTASADFPLFHPLQATLLGGEDAYVASFDGNGAPRFSTYLGGAGYDEGHAIALDAAGAVYVGGAAESGFPTTAGAYSQSGNGFVAKLDANATQLELATMFAGIPNALALDANGRVFACGATTDYSFPTTFNAYMTDHGGAYKGHVFQAFVTAFRADLASLAWSTYYGTEWADEIASALVVDAAGEATIAGTVYGAFAQPDAFLAKFSRDGGALAYEQTTGSGATYGLGLARDANGQITLVGQTWSSAFPAGGGSLQPRYGGSADGFVTIYAAPAGSVLAVTFASTKVVGGLAMTGTVTLDGDAPPGGMVVTLNSSDPAVASVPSSVTVAGGECSESFTIQTASVAAATSVTIDANWAGTASRSFQVWLGPTYLIAPLGTLAGAESSARAIDAAGRITGRSRGSDLAFHVVRYLDGGVVEDLGQGEGDDINASGQVAATLGHALRFTDGVGMADLGTFAGGSQSAASGINDAGQVVGWSDGRKIQQHAFRFTDGLGMQDLGTLGGALSSANGINASGQVAGQSYLAGNGAWRAFRYTDGVGLVDLGVPAGFAHSYGYAINDSGQVAGVAADSGFVVQHAFRHTDGVGVVDLGTLPGESASFGWSINASGRVAGYSGARVFLYVDGVGMEDVNDMVAPEQLFGWSFANGPLDVSDADVIVGTAAWKGGPSFESAFRLEPSKARWFNYGAGWPGTRGVPAFIALNDPILGTTVTLDVQNSFGQPTAALLLIGFQQTDLHSSWGGDLLVVPALTIPITFSFGSNSFSGSLPHDDALVGVNVDLQVFEFDPGASKGVSFTQGLDLVLGY
jgi:probable HAF family extracellular repeat protein